MPRRSVVADSEDDQSLEEEALQRGKRSNAAIDEEDEDDDDDDDDDVEMTFSSQFPDMSQKIVVPKANEQTKLLEMSSDKREAEITKLTRTVLFKALAHEAIDRAKCVKDAEVDSKLSNALYEQVQMRLQNAFGFELKKIPVFMENIKGLQEKYKNRYYLVNTVQDENGLHHKRIYAVHDESARDKGLLMVVLALTYCHGKPRADGSRWILDRDLYALLHKMDENIPEDSLEAGKKGSSTQQSQRTRRDTSLTPDVDECMTMFEKRDYLLKVKASEFANTQDAALENRFFYSMGPRAMLEIGRQQVIYFCSEILEQEIEPHMLKELEGDEDEQAYSQAME